MSVIVSGLVFHYIKSCARTEAKVVRVGLRGIEGDREFMIVEEASDGSAHWPMCTQRVYPQMSRIVPKKEGNDLHVSLPSGREFWLSFGTFRGTTEMQVSVHKKPLWGMDQGDKAAEFVSEVIGKRCRVVRFPYRRHRYDSLDRSELAYADGFPFLIHGDSSLDVVDEKALARGWEKFSADRFRANIRLSNSSPFEEDSFAMLRVGKVLLEGGTLCDRCQIPAVVQEEGRRDPSRNPNTILAEDLGRRFEPNPPKVVRAGVYFGRNFSHLSEGEIYVDQKVEVLERD